MKDGCEDWDLWLSFIELGLSPYRLNEILFNYRVQQNDRSQHATENNTWMKEIIKNHIDLYLNHKDFGSRLFFSSSRLKKKNKKYKRLSKIFFSFAVICLLVIVIIACILN